MVPELRTRTKHPQLAHCMHELSAPPEDAQATAAARPRPPQFGRKSKGEGGERRRRGIRCTAKIQQKKHKLSVSEHQCVLLGSLGP